MNQGKLEVVNDILGISELKWMGRVNLIQMSILSTTVRKNPSEEME